MHKQAGAFVAKTSELYCDSHENCKFDALAFTVGRSKVYYCTSAWAKSVLNSLHALGVWCMASNTKAINKLLKHNETSLMLETS